MKHFENEDDLLLLLADQEKALGQVYPKVTKISQTWLAPDMDLLKITERHQAGPVLAGYECKVLTRRRNVLGPVYAGLGQVLCYFRYGLDQAWLVIGLPSELAPETEQRLGHIFRSLQQSSVIPRYVGMRWIRQGHAYFTQEVEPDSKLYAQSDSESFMRKSLLMKQFLWTKKIGSHRVG